MLKFGHGVADITPEERVELFGYYTYFEPMRVSTGIHSHLNAQSLVLDDGITKVALISCDLCEISREIVEKAKKLIKKRTGIENVVISMTHTHSAPAACFGRGLGKIDKKYYNKIPERIASSVWVADIDAKYNKKGKISAGKILVDGLSYNRSFPNGYVEKELSVLNLGENILCNFTCHPVTQKRERYEREDGSYNKASTMVSGDYPGVASWLIYNLVEKKMMFFQGADGDIDPLDKVYNQTGRTEEMALRFTAKLLEACHNSKEIPPEDRKLYFKQFSVRLDLVVPTIEDIEKVAEKRCSQKHKGWVKFWKHWKRSMVKKLKTDTPPPSYVEAEISVLAIGNCVMLFHPAELYSEVGRKIKDASPFEHTWVVSNSNGTVGYVSTDDPKDTRKEYSGEVAPAACDMFPYEYGQGEKLSNALIEAAKDAYNKLNS